MGGGDLSKPILYKANETNFSTLGLGVLADEVKTLVTEERNGQFYLEMKYPIAGIRFKELKNDRLIKADASHNLKGQRFKIIRVSKPAKGIVTVYAEHVSNHTADLPLKPNVEYTGNAQSALNIWSNNLVDDHPFTVYSDISTTGNGTWALDEVDNARQALGGVRGSILDTYGGEYRFDNYHIGLYQDRGDDNGLPIMYGKNLIDLEQEEEITNTYTSIMPYAYHQSEEADEQEEITLPEYFVDSEHIDKYARRKILKVNFTEDEITNADELRKRAERYIEENNVGVPKVNLRVKFIDLAKTLDYKNVAKAEEINLCDWVTVYFKELDIKLKAKVIKTIWNVTLERYEEIEIGETRANLSQSISDTVDGKLEYVDQRINRVQTAANGKNKVFRGPDEPKAGMSLNDLWYRPVGDGEVEMYRFTGEIWQLEKISGGLIGGTIDAGSGDLDIINMNANNITANRGNFVQLALNEANSDVYITGDDLRYIHRNTGSETRMNADGLFHHEGGTNYSTHYLTHVQTVSALNNTNSSPKWVQLPEIFKGKEFQAWIMPSDTYGVTNDLNYYNLAMLRLVCHIKDYDRANGRVSVVGYSYHRDLRNNNRFYKDISATLVVTY